MNTAQCKRLLAMGLALCLLIAVLFSVFFLAAEANHHCTGNHCPVCEEIKVAQSLLNGVKTALLTAAVLTVLRLGTQKAVVLGGRRAEARLSPVDLQVKLLS